MPWRDVFRKITEPAEPPETPAQPQPPADAGRPAARSLPPHMQRIVGERKRPPASEDGPRDRQARLARLERNRLAAIYDVEQGELAASPDNPWQERIVLLTEAMKTVEEDMVRARVVQPGPYYPLPATPITDCHVETEPVADVAFTVGGERFHYAEDLDWAERGHQVTHGDLRRREGAVASLLPADVPDDLREALRAHLEESLFVFASDLRDRTLDQQPLPAQPTLAELARPCPTCGGWLDWQGRCQVCRQREAGVQALRREENRLLAERAREAEERHRLAERLPVARRRLMDIEAEIEALAAQM